MMMSLNGDLKQFMERQAQVEGICHRNKMPDGADLPFALGEKVIDEVLRIISQKVHPWVDRGNFQLRETKIPLSEQLNIEKLIADSNISYSIDDDPKNLTPQQLKTVLFHELLIMLNNASSEILISKQNAASERTFQSHASEYEEVATPFRNVALRVTAQAMKPGEKSRSLVSYDLVFHPQLPEKTLQVQQAGK